MRLVGINAITRKDDCEKYRAIFEMDGERIEKMVYLTHTAKLVCRDATVRLELTRALVRKAREASRDFAYMKHGEEWKEHVEWGGFFASPTEDEVQMINEAFV